MELRKWSANDASLLQDIPLDHLSLARLYDPLGFITPCVMIAKAILKDSWMARIKRNDGSLAQLDWDEPLPTELLDRWQGFIQNLPYVEQIQLPRWLRFNIHELASLQLHVFCDGSSLAYAACAYIRAELPNGKIQTHLLAARSRVTPTKPITIPRDNKLLKPPSWQ
ncbi:uncharacterized protein LOC117193935 [Drosophila miranda]|uniref:uncharacterized protein LOC117193935 n=1 Tax=Drosophila miranda TaxID=7229 RepID=UPI00143F5276|nr:uncharacterized protein LOC117193935 [Drosophila miranda]